MTQSGPDESGFGEQLEQAIAEAADTTVGDLIEMFGEKSFAILFVLLLGVPALPLPTGGATHVFEIVALLLALQLIVGRRGIWLPRRWRTLRLGGRGRTRFLAALLKLVRWLERFSRPRLSGVFGHRASNSVFGALAACGSVAAFVAPPFSGLDTLPALGVVIVSLGVLLEDIVVVAAGVTVGAAGIVLVVVIGKAVLETLF